jgi:hypothetical protein
VLMMHIASDGENKEGNNNIINNNDNNASSSSGSGYYLEGVGGRGVIITGGGCFLLGVLMMDWLFQSCLRNLHRQSLARTLRAASLMQTISLILWTLLPTHIEKTKTDVLTLPSSSSDPDLQRMTSSDSSVGQQIKNIRLLSAAVDESFSHTHDIHASTLLDDFIGTCAFAFLLGAIACCLIHKRAWIPSLPDCQSPKSLPTWLLHLADAIGAFFGPYLFVLLLGDAVSAQNAAMGLGFILQAAAFGGVALCVASACFGA